MSTGGNVPAQGFAVQEATTAKKRGDRSMGHPNGYVGKGTTSSRLKSRHRRDMKITKQKVGLREYARRLASDKTAPEEDVEDAKAWLQRKAS